MQVTLEKNKLLKNEPWTTIIFYRYAENAMAKKGRHVNRSQPNKQIMTLDKDAQ